MVTMKVFEIYEGRWHIPTNEITSLIYEYTTDIDIGSDLEQIIFELNNNNEVNEQVVRTEFEKYFKKFSNNKCSSCIYYGLFYNSKNVCKEHCNKIKHPFSGDGCEDYKKRGLK